MSYSLVLPQDFFYKVPDFWNVFLFCSAMVCSYLSVSFGSFLGLRPPLLWLMV